MCINSIVSDFIIITLALSDVNVNVKIFLIIAALDLGRCRV